ncbi:MAG: arsenosugar biosynthesis radical SAM protein ArsS [Gammaproteobacteria bacterium]|nr:arsenosugar biosynthesis radical SAM protein ArsS [Gammaproteobacteria bacterium]MCF6230707.1 arsenosugar biosynthesis radical SAM protein ArsS [Gammaproteobacteria bacterium]
MLETLPLLAQRAFPTIQRSQLQTLQVNLGYRCNLQCLHCHVNAGPKRTEAMSRETIDQLLKLIDSGNLKTLDLTGGAPELNDHFRYLVSEARKRGLTVIDRCNLTILQAPGEESLAAFLAQQQVEVVASLPCYLEENVDAQRGKGTFADSIQGLQKLNALGYGVDGSSLRLNLVYNPQTAVLPPPQAPLEQAYKEALWQRYGIRFNQLFTITNVPVKRFGSLLLSTGQFELYMDLLQKSFSEDNLESVMCRTLLSIDWQGYLYDCDFNQMLGLPVGCGAGKPLHLTALTKANLEGEPITVRDHCYACTAGQGSSCGGALAEE